MQSANNDIIVLLLFAIFLIMLMAGFIFFILFLHNKKQVKLKEELKRIESNFEKNILNTQLEIQEQTFQHISKEIHDNISLSLTLAKLNLNTMDWNDRENGILKVDSSIELITQSIIQLNDLSKSLDADIISQHGMLAAIEQELQRIKCTGSFYINYTVTGNPVYMNIQTELIIFRIIQEAFNNIIKHANANEVSLLLHYIDNKLQIHVNDDGNGFDIEFSPSGQHLGLRNMKDRTILLGGEMEVISKPGSGTSLIFTFPFDFK